MRYLTRRLLADGAHAVGVAAAEVAVRTTKTIVKAAAIGTVLALTFLAGAGLMAAAFALQPHRVDCTYTPSGGPFGP